MLTLDDAKKIANKNHEHFSQYDSWHEYDKAYVFAVSEYEGVGGFLMPFIVMKNDGSVNFTYSQAMMLGTLGEEISKGKLD